MGVAVSQHWAGAQALVDLPVVRQGLPCSIFWAPSMPDGRLDVSIHMLVCAQAALASGMSMQSQAEVGGALQVFHNLHELPAVRVSLHEDHSEMPDQTWFHVCCYVDGHKVSVLVPD